MDYSYTDISKMIDHAMLSPTLAVADLEAGCRLAVAYDVASVCIVPYFVQRCAEILQDSSVKPGTTIGFPHGVQATSTKQAETVQALADGCEEVDMVVNISKVLSGDWDYVRSDIMAVADAAHDAGKKVKVIFENCYLAEEHKIQLCQICANLNVDWVKTTTGFGTEGATMDDLKLMRTHCPDHVQVKASGGIRDFNKLLEVRALGVTRVGASATSTILDECRRQLQMEPIVAAEAANSTGY